MTRVARLGLGLLWLLAACSKSASPTPARDPNKCSAPLPVDVSHATLEDIVAKLCAQKPLGGGVPRVSRWDGTCSGSIIVVNPTGVDCAASFYFDETTHALQAIANACNSGPFCSSGIPGFRLPSECSDGPMTVTQYCLDDQLDAAVGTDAADTGSDAGATDVSDALPSF